MGNWYGSELLAFLEADLSTLYWHAFFLLFQITARLILPWWSEFETPYLKSESTKGSIFTLTLCELFGWSNIEQPQDGIDTCPH